MREPKYWVLNAFAALVILVLLGLHMALMHLDGLLAALFGTPLDPLAWEGLLERARSLFFTVTYVLLLAAALFHGLYGLRNMLTEFWAGQRAEKLIGVCCWMAGIGLFSVGAFATVYFHVSAGGS